MQTTFRLGEIILCSLIALRRVLECVEHIFEYSLGPRMDVLAPEFQLPIGNHIALLRALFWDLRVPINSSKIVRFHFLIHPCPQQLATRAGHVLFLSPWRGLPYMAKRIKFDW